MGIDIVSRLLFPTPPASYTVDSFPEELIWVPKTLDPNTCSPEDCVPCLFLSYSSARFIVFYLHSNAEDIGRCHAFCSSVRAQFQVHVLAVEYPGYGICPGGPCDEQRVTENAFAAFRFVREVLAWPLDSILILGRSIGCGPAISLAVRYQVSGVIVVSPMLSVKEICKDAVGPLAHLFEERFPNKDRVPLIRSPFLVVHGQKDMMIPCRHGVELYGVCRSRKLLVCPKEMEHNSNLLANVTYFVLPMLQFFSLPDYCFEDIQVPSWAYDKRLSPYFVDPEKPGAPLHQPQLKSSSFSEDKCETPTMPTMGCFTCPSMPRSKGEQDEGLPSLREWLFGHKVGPTTSETTPVKYPWAMSAPAAQSPFSQSRRIADNTIVMNSPSPAEHHRAFSATDRPIVQALEGTFGRPAARVVAPPRAAMASPTSPPLVDPLPSMSRTAQTGGRPQRSSTQDSDGSHNGNVLNTQQRAATGSREAQASKPPLASPPTKVSRDSSVNPKAIEEAIAASRSTPVIRPADFQEQTASRNRFQEFTSTPPWSPGPAQHREIQKAPATTHSPRATSPSDRLKLLTPIDLVEIVTDLERHFAAEPLDAPNPRADGTDDKGPAAKIDKAEREEKVVPPASPVPIPPRSPMLFGRISDRFKSLQG